MACDEPPCFPHFTPLFKPLNCPLVRAPARRCKLLHWLTLCKGSTLQPSLKVTANCQLIPFDPRPHPLSPSPYPILLCTHLVCLGLPQHTFASCCSGSELPHNSGAILGTCQPCSCPAD
jgi:hypothetical protein